MQIPVNRPSISSNDIEAVTHSLKETWLSGETQAIPLLEENLSRYIGVKQTVLVASGTTAIDLAISALELEEGAECVVPTFTIISTVSNLLRHKAKLKLIDADPITWSMNSVDASQGMSEKTKLVVPVHIYGMSTDMDILIETAKKFNVFVLEDAAESLGVEYKGSKCGSLGNAAVFSFYSNKIITGGEGGAICTNDENFSKRLRYFRNLCFNDSERFVHRDLGWNYRMSGLSATLVNSQLNRIEQLLKRKVEIGKLYIEGLRNHPWINSPIQSNDYTENKFWVYPILLNENAPVDAKTLSLKLTSLGIGNRRFFCPLHLQPVLRNYDFELTSDMSVSENLWNNGLYLPSGNGISNPEIEYVIEKLWSLKDYKFAR